MTPAGWLAWGVVVVAFGLVCWGLRADSRERTEIRAVLDELAGDYRSPADRIAAVEDQLGEVVAHLDGNAPAAGRHAHTGELTAP